NEGRKRRSESEEEVAKNKSSTSDGSDISTETRSTGQTLSDKELLQVANTLGQEWEQVAIHLELKNKDLEDIKAEHSTVAMQKQKMLVIWRRRRPQDKATAQDLLRGLEDLEDLPLETRQLLTGDTDTSACGSLSGKVTGRHASSVVCPTPGTPEALPVSESVL
ncbi:unnamed protein product, partial [Arctogadus glacialis]